MSNKLQLIELVGSISAFAVPHRGKAAYSPDKQWFQVSLVQILGDVLRD